MTILVIALTLMSSVKQSDKPPCFSVTNYWSFDEAGNHKAYGGQADGDPYHTTNMTDIIGPHQAWAWVDAPLPLVGKSVTVPGYGTFPVNDTFGDPTYQAGAFYHHGWDRIVIPIDIFTPTPIYDLVCGGTINN